MPDAQLQDLFDRSTVALLKQGKAAFDEARQACAHRAPDGLKCAVGHLIPDDAYNPALDNDDEDSSILSTSAAFDDLRTLLTGSPETDTEATRLLESLQIAHDCVLRSTGVAAWKERLQDIANEIGLSTKVLDDHVTA